MTDEHVLDLIPAYALGVLTADDVAVVRAHLDDCDHCQAELAAYETVVAALAHAIPEQAPSPHLERHLRDRLARSAKPETHTEAGGTSGWLGWLRPQWLIPIVALVLLLVGGWWLLQPTTTIELVGTDIAPQAVGTLTVAGNRPRGTLVVEGLPVLEPDQQYQLWLIQGDQRISGAVFSVDAQGAGRITVEGPNPITSYSAIGISIEPAGGSPGPTGPKAMGNL